MIGGAKRIGHMAEIDLVLAGRVLRGSTLGGQRLGLAIAGKAGEESVLLVERIQAVELAGMGLCGRSLVAQRARPAVTARLRPDQVELELERADRLQAEVGEPARDRAEQRARIGERRPAVSIAQPCQHLRAARPPGHRREGRRIDPARPVGVALLPDQARRIDIGAGRIHAVERARKAQAAAQPAGEACRRQALAAGDADQVRQDQIDRRGRRIAREEGLPGLARRQRRLGHVGTERKPRRRGITSGDGGARLERLLDPLVQLALGRCARPWSR